MSSFVETESERRSQERSNTLIPADLMLENEVKSIFLMDLRRTGCRAVVGLPKAAVPEGVKIKLELPKHEPIFFLAQAKVLKKLAKDRWHVAFDRFEFVSKSDERVMLSYLNEVEAQSDDLASKALKGLGDEELRRLSRLVQASRTLNPCQSYIQAIEQVIDVTRRELAAERGLLLVPRGEDEIAVEVARGTSAIKQRGLRFSSTVARSVLETGEPLLSLDAQTDQALGAVSSIKMLGTVSVMCVPLGTPDRLYGLLYVDNTMSRGLFRESDLAMATIIADLATASLEKNWHHQFAIQAERVSSTKNLVSSMSRDLLPSLKVLRSLTDSAEDDGLSAIKAEQLQARVSKCLETVERVLPLGATVGRKRDYSDLMDVFEEIALDFEDNISLPLPPDGQGWPKLHLDLENLTTIVTALLKAAVGRKSVPARILVAVQKNVFKLTIVSTELVLSDRNLRRAFHPFTGMGLNEAQRLVHEHRGLLRVNVDPAGGIVFTVELPLEE
jgi:hypothetical protein